MLPAANAGVGGNVGFPDVCLTPTPAGPVPVPYPNIGMNAMSLGFAPNVFVSCVPANNMATKIAMTNGDQGGAAHATMMGAGGYTMGMPNVFVNQLPAQSLACPTNGNNYNNPLGATLIPSVVNVFYNRLPDASAGEPVSLGEELQRHERPAVGSFAADGTPVVRISAFTRDSVSAVCREIDRLAAEANRRGHNLPALELDLRDNHGGEIDVALRVAGLFLPLDAELVTITRHDGDRVVRNPQPARYDLPLRVRVNRQTASAAETVAAILERHDRARIVGGPTYGKTTITDNAGTVIGHVAV